MPKNFDSKSLVLKYLQEIPDFKDCILEEVNDGVSTEVYKLTNKGIVYYVRISQDKDMWKKEADVYKILKNKNLHIPEVILKANTDEIYFLITSEILGKPISANSENLEEILEYAGEELGIINSIPVKSFGYFDDTPYEKYEDFLFRNFEEKVNTLTSIGLITNSQKKNLLTLGERYRKLASEIRRPYLSHGDFDFSQIFESDGKYSGIIDFGDIRGSSQFHDLSHFCTVEQDSYLKPLLRGFKKIVNMPTNWADFINMEVLGICVSRLNWIIRDTPERILTDHPAVRKLRCLADSS